MSLTFVSCPTKKDSRSLPDAMKCLKCAKVLRVEEALDGAVFYNAASTIFECKIAFDCPSCAHRGYFSLREDSIEFGDLGASPVFDPIPGPEYSYPDGFRFSFAHEKGRLFIQAFSRTWGIPEYGKAF